MTDDKEQEIDTRDAVIVDRMSWRAILAPGNGCTNVSRSMWYPWVARKLTEVGLKLELRTFPDPYDAHENVWLPFMRNELKAGTDTIIIGHSSGACAALRFAEKWPVAGIVLVAAYASDLGDAGERESGYFNRPWDWQAIKRNCGFIIQYHSADDHLVPLEEAQRVQQEIGSEFRMYLDMGHFQMDTFEDLVDAVLSKRAGDDPIDRIAKGITN